MNTSESITKLAAALLRAQRAITFAIKDAKNPQFRSTYADLSSVIEACKPALNEAGISFLQMPAPSDTGTLAMTTRLLHESGEWIEATATCPLQKHDPQGYGSAITYLRRYSLAAAVGLYQDDDDGNATSRKPAEKARTGVVADVLAAMPKPTAEDAQYFAELADNVETLFISKGPCTAYDRIQAEGLDNEQMMYLWSRLGSKVRGALKAEKQARAA